MIDVAQLHFIYQVRTSNHISITLCKLTIAAFLRPVCTPHRLYLVTSVRECKSSMIHGNMPCKRNGEVIFQRPFGKVAAALSFQYFFKTSLGFVYVFWVVNTVVEYLKNKLVAFFTILAHQCI